MENAEGENNENKGMDEIKEENEIQEGKKEEEGEGGEQPMNENILPDRPVTPSDVEEIGSYMELQLQELYSETYLEFCYDISARSSCFCTLQLQSTFHRFDMNWNSVPLSLS